MAHATNERPSHPDAVMPMFVERANAGDAEGMAALYEQGAVLAYPPGNEIRGQEAILEACRGLVARGVTFQLEQQLSTIVHGDLALTSSVSADGMGVRVQVLRRQADGSWLRVIDRPEAVKQQA